MSVLEDAKAKIERITGIWRPAQKDVRSAVRQIRAKTFRFEDSGVIPNNPALALVVYKRGLKFAKRFDPAAVIEEVFAANGWGDGWRDSIYHFDHFHAHTHEALGIARGHARARFGGEKGREIAIAAGDVIVIPAGTGHMKVDASGDLLVVGAYPSGGRYDERKVGTSAATKAAIRRVPMPKSDPIYGRSGGIMKLWKAKT
jgi:uncharacterized protein YjlB